MRIGKFQTLNQIDAQRPFNILGLNIKWTGGQEPSMWTQVLLPRTEKFFLHGETNKSTWPQGPTDEESQRFSQLSRLRKSCDSSEPNLEKRKISRSVLRRADSVDLWICYLFIRERWAWRWAEQIPGRIHVAVGSGLCGPITAAVVVST